MKLRISFWESVHIRHGVSSERRVQAASSSACGTAKGQQLMSRSVFNFGLQPVKDCRNFLTLTIEGSLTLARCISAALRWGQVFVVKNQSASSTIYKNYRISFRSFLGTIRAAMQKSIELDHEYGILVTTG